MDTVRSVQVEVPFPLTAALVREFVDGVPDEAEVTVYVVEGGSQRDPFPIAYRLTARWSV